jgi:hypothetical protein
MMNNLYKPILLHKHGILLRFAGAWAKAVRAECASLRQQAFIRGAKWNRMYQVYEQKKRLPQTSIGELKGIKNKN